MKIITEKIVCDICNKNAIESVRYPVIFHTDQTEGRETKPYISMESLDLCKQCLDKVIKIEAWGAQGNNRYKIVEQ